MSSWRFIAESSVWCGAQGLLFFSLTSTRGVVVMNDGVYSSLLIKLSVDFTFSPVWNLLLQTAVLGPGEERGYLWTGLIRNRAVEL